MIPEDYFGNWIKVIDLNELQKVLGKLNTINLELLCPHPSNVFRAFKLCPYNSVKMLWLAQDPYPQKGVAQGIVFGNSADTPEDKLSPSLEVIKEACIDYSIPHNTIEFDNTLESWAKQGILMINSALTCKVNEVGSHVMLWRPFISKLLYNLSHKESGIIYVLFGRQAQTFEPYINNTNNYVLKIEHPAYYARINKSMPHSIFSDMNNILMNTYGESIEWYKEY